MTRRHGGACHAGARRSLLCAPIGLAPPLVLAIPGQITVTALARKLAVPRLSARRTAHPLVVLSRRDGMKPSAADGAATPIGTPVRHPRGLPQGSPYPRTSGVALDLTENTPPAGEISGSSFCRRVDPSQATAEAEVAELVEAMHETENGGALGRGRAVRRKEVVPGGREGGHVGSHRSWGGRQSVAAPSTSRARVARVMCAQDKVSAA